MRNEDLPLFVLGELIIIHSLEHFALSLLHYVASRYLLVFPIEHMPPVDSQSLSRCEQLGQSTLAQLRKLLYCPEEVCL